MAKAILMSIKPQWVAKILNGEKTVEIRKRFPSDYVGWVYIYCTKENDLFKSYIRMGYCTTRSTADNIKYNGKGKVVARFWCDKVEEITTRQDRFKEFMFYETSLDTNDLCKQSCLDYNELDNYLYGEKGYAIHITKLEIFDKPKEISEFRVYCYTHPLGIDIKIPLTRAPQSWGYIEI